MIDRVYRTLRQSGRSHRVVLLCGVLFISAIWFWTSLPEPLFNAPLSFIANDRDGRLLGAKAAADGQWRFPPARTVPERFVTALIHFEDKRFFNHSGIDPLALLRAAYLNLKHQRVRSGGSTLSMQVIRMARQRPDRSFGEKLIEMLLAVRLEIGYSKKEILTLYSAQAPFGGNVVGLAAAAWRYFGRGASELTWAEACALAVLPNNPALIHPGRDRAALLEKRNGLLARLHARGVLSAIELNMARREPLPPAPSSLPRTAPHLLDTLIHNYGVSGATFDTALDAALQRQVRDIVTRHGNELEKQGIRNAAVLVIDNDSFDVLAYVGNSQYGDRDGYAVDLIPRPRSTGSVLKPLLFATMLQEGELTPATLVPDVPLHYAGYMPENFDRLYRGAVPARYALAQSLNVPAVYMLARRGVAPFYDFLQHLGMTTLHRAPNEYGLSLILGGAEGTLWELTSLYANLAFLAKADRARGELTYRQARVLRNQGAATEARSDLGSGAAWLTLQALIDVARPGNDAFWRRFSSTQKIAWKTGTSFGQRDGWALGSTPRFTVGVWTGNANGEGRPGLTGVNSAAPLMLEIFQRLPHAEWFPRPENQLTTISVCREDGYLANADCPHTTATVPRDSIFVQNSPYYRRVHLDATGQWRVDSRCESVASMQTRSWFVLPASQEYFYRKLHGEYRPLPPWRADCRTDARAAKQDSGRSEERAPIEVLYPAAKTLLYIPVDLGARRSRTVFEAVHREPERTVFWHIDDAYLGATTTFHQMALDVTAGQHSLVLVDDQGNRVEREFTVLDKDNAQ